MVVISINKNKLDELHRYPCEANDTNLSTSPSSLLEIDNRINNDLHNVNTWLETNRLTPKKILLIAS